MTKQELRRNLRQKRQALSTEYCAGADAVIARRLLESPEYQSAETILCYASVWGEPETGSILRAALEAGKTVCVPLCTGRSTMEARQITSTDELSAGHYGILEPPAESSCIPAERIGLVIVPCVSADTLCGRLGHGTGTYDGYLKQCSAPRLCLCYSAMLTPGRIPMDEADEYMDCVITEAGCFRRER